MTWTAHSRGIPPEQRAFSEDYKKGALADEQGSLTDDGEGRSLTAKYIAGRPTLCHDVGLRPQEVAKIAEGRIGGGPESWPKKALPRGLIGGPSNQRGRDGAIREIGVLNDLAPDVSSSSVMELILSGDVLFAGSVGRTDLPGADWETLLASLRTLVDTYPGETVVHPGHGPSTTLGQELARNPFLAELRHERQEPVE